MPNRKYIRAAQQERDDLKRYSAMGYNIVRSAGSKGIVDGFAWNSNEAVFICSRRYLWTEKDINKVMKRIQLFPNSKVIFFAKLPDGEHAIIRYPEIETSLSSAKLLILDKKVSKGL